MTSETDFILIEIPSGFESLSESDRVACLNHRMCQLPFASAALDLECDASASAPVLERVMIQSVTTNQRRVEIEYVVDFTEFRACQLETRLWTFRRQLSGRIEDDRLIFRRFVAPERRTTVEEF